MMEATFCFFFHMRVCVFAFNFFFLLMIGGGGCIRFSV